MLQTIFPLDRLEIGRSAIVSHLSPDAGIKRRLLDLGFTAGAKVEAVLKSPRRDPIAYQIRGAVIALRNEDAAVVLCRRGNE